MRLYQYLDLANQVTLLAAYNKQRDELDCRLQTLEQQFEDLVKKNDQMASKEVNTALRIEAFERRLEQYQRANKEIVSAFRLVACSVDALLLMSHWIFIASHDDCIS